LQQKIQLPLWREHLVAVAGADRQLHRLEIGQFRKNPMPEF
jgi:hypothetical protein